MRFLLATSSEIFLLNKFKKIKLKKNALMNQTPREKSQQSNKRPLRSLKNRGPQLGKNHHYFSETRMDGREYFGMGLSKLPKSRVNSPNLTQSSKTVRRRIRTESDVGTQLPINAISFAKKRMKTDFTPNTGWVNTDYIFDRVIWSIFSVSFYFSRKLDNDLRTEIPQ